MTLESDSELPDSHASSTVSAESSNHLESDVRIGSQNIPCKRDTETNGLVTLHDQIENLTDSQRSILRIMVENKITSERRRRTQAEIVRLINRMHKPASYGREFASMVKTGILAAREGTKGGTWIVPTHITGIEHALKDE